MISFTRKELGIISGVYGKLVASGEWRDYGISSLKDVAIFSIHRKSSEYPIFRVEKRPNQLERNGLYSVIAIDGRVLKRGSELSAVIGVLNQKLIKLIK